MRIIFISPNRALHQQWNKAIRSSINIMNIYIEDEIKEFDFYTSDIVLFDLDNLEEFLIYTLNAKTIALSSKLDEVKGFNLLKKGIKGYGNNYMTPMNLKDAISIINDGKIWIYPELMSFIIQHSTLKNTPKKSSEIDKLSSRELDVSKGVAKGYTNKEIASELDITERTVKAHITTIFSKLNIKDRVTLGIMIKEHF